MQADRERFLHRVDGHPSWILGWETLNKLKEYVKQNPELYSSYDIVYHVTGFVIFHLFYTDLSNTCNHLKEMY